MPNRIIKESICTSDTIDCLSDFEEVVFYRLIVNCDDFGRFDARAKVLSSKLFPLKNISVEQMQDAIDSLCKAGLITVYLVDNRPYLQMTTWQKHQTTRAKKSKYPSPSENICKQIQADESCKQMQADESKCTQMSPYSLYENRNTRTLYDAGARAREENDNDDDDFNPFGDGGPDHPDMTTLEAYAANNIMNMYNGRNMEKLLAYRDTMPDDLIRYGIDLANKSCRTGVPTFAYVESILRGFEQRKLLTVAQAEAAEEARHKQSAEPQPSKSAQTESERFWGNVPFY